MDWAVVLLILDFSKIFLACFFWVLFFFFLIVKLAPFPLLNLDGGDQYSYIFFRSKSRVVLSVIPMIRSLHFS